MNKLAAREYPEPEQADINETLQTLSGMVEYAKSQALGHNLKFLGYLLDMALVEIKTELGKPHSRQ